MGAAQSYDYQTGDVVLFHCLTLHKALPNTHLDVLRLSFDVRFQPASDPIHTRRVDGTVAA